MLDRSDLYLRVIKRYKPTTLDFLRSNLSKALASPYEPAKVGLFFLVAFNYSMQ